MMATGVERIEMIHNTKKKLPLIKIWENVSVVTFEITEDTEIIYRRTSNITLPPAPRSITVKQVIQ